MDNTFWRKYQICIAYMKIWIQKNNNIYSYINLALEWHANLAVRGDQKEGCIIYQVIVVSMAILRSIFIKHRMPEFLDFFLFVHFHFYFFRVELSILKITLIVSEHCFNFKQKISHHGTIIYIFLAAIAALYLGSSLTHSFTD